MGVYINMEMPKNCGECLLAKLSPTGESLICNYMLSRVLWKERPFDCPLIPVPEHGRVIDADMLDVIGYCDIPQGYEDTFDDGVMWLAEQIDLLPTIIPAEEDE